MDDVVCDGTESGILFCDNRWDSDDCSHSQDVSVSCVTGMKLITTVTDF